jgi:hypothetical protein
MGYRHGEWSPVYNYDAWRRWDLEPDTRAHRIRNEPNQVNARARNARLPGNGIGERRDRCIDHASAVGGCDRRRPVARADRYENRQDEKADPRLNHAASEV